MRRFGLIGRPLGHSASAAYFAAKFEREGIADCTYTLYELPEIGALERLLAETPDLCGFNVTIPYKREVMALLDDLSHDARLVGAVNCVRRTADSRLVGHNTDVIGLRAAFDCLLGGEQPSHALVLGTGGASQAVQYVLAERGIPFDLVSRDAAKGNYTYDNLPCEAVEHRPWEPTPPSMPRRESPTATLRPGTTCSTWYTTRPCPGSSTWGASAGRAYSTAR